MEDDELSQSDPPTAVDVSAFRNGQEARDTDIFIAVMGVTGAGKSTLISHLVTEGGSPQIGNNLSSCA
jgi:ABC-type lipoprotein export system ATPase subunit